MKTRFLGILFLFCLVRLVPAGEEDKDDSKEDKDKKEDVGTVIGIDLGTTYSW